MEFEAVRGDKASSDIAIDDVLVGQCIGVVNSYYEAVKEEDDLESKTQEDGNSNNYIKKMG